MRRRRGRRWTRWRSSIATAVYGAPRFAAAARRAGIRPLVGADVTLVDGPPLLLLVENRTGYRNLCRLLTRAREGLCKADPPRATRELLAEHASGLIALGGAAPRAIFRRSARRSDQRTSIWKCSATSTRARPGMNARSRRRRRRRAWDWWRPTTSATPRRGSVWSTTSSPARVKSAPSTRSAGACCQNSEALAQVAARDVALFADRPAAVRATRAIAERCQFSLADLGYTFPRYAVPDGETEQSTLEKLCEAGVGHRYAADDPLRPKGARAAHAGSWGSSGGSASPATSSWSGTSFRSRSRRTS